MTYKLRDYQQEAVDTAIKWLKSTTDPGLIEAYTAAGKSMIIAEIARIITSTTGKKVLVLQPNKELLTQNAAKYEMTGEKCSIFSASKNQTSLRYNVVFGTALTVKNKLNLFCDKFGLIILDEADASLTPTILSIIESISKKNPRLRILGLTSSPYKLGHGYIYALDINDKPVPEDKAKRPFFTKQIVHISGRDLLERGFVSPVIIGSINEGYDTSNLQVNSMGKFTSASVDQAFAGHGRKTSAIIADVVAQSRDRKSVLIFAATQKHAEECFASLPPHLSAVVTDKTTPVERDQIVKDFTNCKLKYLVNVQVFTRGTDFPQLDVIALLRATESSALLHQIIGRGVRIAEGKEDCLLLDYAANIDNHHPDGDLFNPVIKAWNDKGESMPIKAICEDCGTENEFTGRDNPDGFGIDEHGYFIDLDGNRIISEYGDMPAHHGRRCFGMQLQKSGKYERCEYRWTFKECPECQEPNDIAARYCSKCKTEIVNPNDKLIADFRALKRDPYRVQTDRVISWSTKKTLSAAGNDVLKVDFTTEYRSLSVWYQIKSGNAFLINQYNKFIESTNGGETMPYSVTYRKSIKTGFYEILTYNQEIDKLEIAS